MHRLFALNDGRQRRNLYPREIQRLGFFLTLLVPKIIVIDIHLVHKTALCGIPIHFVSVGDEHRQASLGVKTVFGQHIAIRQEVAERRAVHVNLRSHLAAELGKGADVVDFYVDRLLCARPQHID